MSAVEEATKRYRGLLLPPLGPDDPLWMTDEEYAFLENIALYGDGLTNPRPDGTCVLDGRLVDRTEGVG